MYFLCELITTKGACPSCNPFNTAGIFFLLRELRFPIVQWSMVVVRGVSRIVQQVETSNFHMHSCLFFQLFNLTYGMIAAECQREFRRKKEQHLMDVCYDFVVRTKFT